MLYRAGPTYLNAAFRSLPAQRLSTSFTPRKEPDGSGCVKLRFVGKTARVLSLEQAFAAVGFAATGLCTDSINTAAEVLAANNAMNNTLKATSSSLGLLKAACDRRWGSRALERRSGSRRRRDPTFHPRRPWRSWCSTGSPHSRLQGQTS